MKVLCLVWSLLLSFPLSSKTFEEGVKYARSQLGKPIEQHDFFTLGKETVSFDMLRGKTTVVYFFASWCAPCYETLENLDTALKSGSTSTTVVAVSFDEDWEALQKMLDVTGFSGDVWKSSTGKMPLRDWMFANYGRSLPYTIKIDENSLLAEQSYHIKTVEQWTAVLTQELPLSKAERIY